MSVPGHPHDRLLDRIDGHLDPAEAARVDAHVAGAPPAPRPGRRAKSARPDDTGFFGMPDPEDAAPGSGGTQG